MLTALEQSLGVVTDAAKKANIERRAHYRWMNEDENYAAAVRDIEEASLDFAESNLFQQIKDGSTAATIFFLKTKGKKRGYIEKQEFENTGDKSENITIEVIDPGDTDQNDNQTGTDEG